MKRIVVAIALLAGMVNVVSADDFGDGRKVKTVSFKAASGTSAISSTNAMTVSTTESAYTNVMRIDRCEFQSVGVTVASTVAIDATWVVEYSLSDGESDDGSINWHELASTSTNVTTATETAPIALRLPACKIIRLKFGADQDATPAEYTVTEAIVARY